VIEYLLCKCKPLSSNPSSIKKKKKKREREREIHYFARHQCLTPIILATQEEEIRRIAV
jgi:hypothetical protein